ncbi:PREDICTED: uncharacterized protein LOC108362189 [Rhagoletis zephyria]|uniref:uncharacterized protein LOC108362189 n=1 Tax=Rhagoletis zephyria TaxID=28612 RepID=UPI0008119E33|nr:PREDICTED: uncharacterized protein LOC108362189 [Rhagoletis zephyria]
MQYLIFGSICSPCSAQYIKNLNAENFRTKYPRAVEGIINRHYVDDYVDSFDSVDEAIDVTLQIKDIHISANFELRRFVSNSKKLLISVADTPTTSLESTTKNMFYGESNSGKILGMYWDTETDQFFFQLKFSKVPNAVLTGKRRPTKAEVLSLMMSIFDPYGFLCNVILASKVMMQELWRQNAGWHAPVPEKIYQDWYKWYNELSKVKDFKAQRCYHLHFTNTESQIDLRIFVDASELAFAAVAYWRVHYQNNVTVIFAYGKSRCSPIKPLSIPRLELQSAVLGVRLKESIVTSHDTQPKNIVLWTDSKTVIQWLHSDARRYKQYVSNRVSEILQTTTPNQWRWVPGKLNPADEGTRLQTFTANSKWLNGPSFLSLCEDEWPLMPDGINSDEKLMEMRTKDLYTVQHHENVIPFNKYSNYYRFLKIMCWVKLAIKRFRSYCIKGESLQPLKISTNVMKDTEYFICRIVQETEFKDEIEILRENRELSKSSALWKLTPSLDGNGILRLSGRLDNASCVPIGTRRPIILPKDHDFTRLIIQHYHELFHHHNQEAIVCAIRYKFWIPNLRRLVQSTKRRCQLCKNLSAVPQTPLMGQLPVDRVTPYTRPFTYTGVDYFGPVWVAVGRRREKRWVAVFTCLTVRVIHLELAKDLSTDAVVLCLRNFMNRRGIPLRIRSDRGTNFIGASKEQWLDMEQGLQRECLRKSIEWVFNTPLHPSAGGAWERMVQSVKKVLSFTLKEKAPQVEVLQSLLIEAENLINSRPLTHIPVESMDADPLTPNHFLLGCPNFVQTSAVPENGCLRKKWHVVQQLKQTFWKRWVLEYLPTLTRRTKWFRRVDPIKIGDVVLICDENESRGQWKRGIVVEAFVAADGQVRSALVKTTQGTLRRPASKLAVLDVCGDSPSLSSNHGGRNVAAQ